MLVLSSSLDREVQAHKHFTGATNIFWLNELMRYVRSEGLLNNFRLYPMVARTNYGTGTTVRGLGKLTSNNMTLVNGPTWGTSGVAFASASSQYGTIADFLGSETLTVFARATVPSINTETIISQYELTGDQRSWRFAGDIAGGIRVWRSSDGTSANLEAYTAATEPTTDTCFVLQWVDGGGRSIWYDKTSQSLILSFGSAVTSRLNGTAAITYNCFLNSGSPDGIANQTAHATAFLTGSVTTAQREQITDLINAL